MKDPYAKQNGRQHSFGALAAIGYRESILKTGLLLFSLVGEVEDVLLVGLHAVVLLT